RAKQLGLKINFSEGDARKVKFTSDSIDCVCLLGNSFGYFEKEEDDLSLLEEIKRILTSKGKLVLDIVDGLWMKQHFEARSWEWIDKSHLVCRERSLSSDEKRIVTREVVINAEEGVIADQFYAERLYTWENLQTLLEKLHFTNIISHGNVLSLSSRNQDLGMMGNRLFVTAIAPEKKKNIPVSPKASLHVTVILGDPRLPDSVKKGGQFNPEDLETIHTLKSTLKKIPHFKFSFLDNHKILLDELVKNPPEFVLNLCDEGYSNQATLELHIPALLEMLKIPYTGAGPTCLGLCYNKSLVRSIATDLGIPVPLETYIDPTDQTAILPSIFPALLKPNCGDSSLGITQDAVVYEAEGLINYLNSLRQLLPGAPVLVQEFLQGPEYSVALVGNQGRFEILPIMEVDYSHLPPDLPKILCYESKWIPESPYWTQIKYKRATLDEETYRKLVDYSVLLFNRLECRDFARFDFRADSQGNIKLLEMNPNPGWCWDGKFNIMAGFKELTYQDLLHMILQAAKDRLFSSKKSS
ncbi:MAG: methyltransferase domain-containing protein, partial [Chlamydiota bacterium]